MVVGPESSLPRIPQAYEKPSATLPLHPLTPSPPLPHQLSPGLGPVSPLPCSRWQWWWADSTPPTLSLSLSSRTRGWEGLLGVGRSLTPSPCPSGAVPLPTPDWKSDTLSPSAALLSSRPWRPMGLRLQSSDCLGLNGQAWRPRQVHHCESSDTCLARRRPCLHGPSLG